MTRTTVLVAGFDERQRACMNAILDAGACVLHAPTLGAALQHLKGGLISIVVLDADATSAADELREEARRIGTPVLEVKTPIDGEELLNAVRDALAR